MKPLVKFRMKGSFNKIHRFFKGAQKRKRFQKILEEAGQNGIERLQEFTPKRTGKTAASWRFELRVEEKKGIAIDWINDNIVKGQSVAYLIQHGHVTPSGGFVEGVDYINPALQPIYDELEEKIEKEVKSKK